MKGSGGNPQITSAPATRRQLALVGVSWRRPTRPHRNLHYFLQARWRLGGLGWAGLGWAGLGPSPPSPPPPPPPPGLGGLLWAEQASWPQQQQQQLEHQQTQQ